MLFVSLLICWYQKTLKLNKGLLCTFVTISTQNTVDSVSAFPVVFDLSVSYRRGQNQRPLLGRACCLRMILAMVLSSSEIRSQLAQCKLYRIGVFLWVFQQGKRRFTFM